MRPSYDFWICCLLGFVVVHTCIQIEVRNDRADGILPRKETGGGKWVKRSTDREVVVEFTKLTRYQRLGTPTSEPVTEEQLNEQLQENLRLNSLRSWVETMGLLQYLLAPLVLIYSVRLAIREKTPIKRAVAATVALLTIGSMCFMFYRGYFTSLD